MHRPIYIFSYLGVSCFLDTRRFFRAHIEAVARSTKLMIDALGRLMPNMEGLGYAKRKLLISAAMSKLTHSALVWAKSSMKIALNRVTIIRPQRQVALRIIRC